jgi:hypothetical protein
MLSTAQYTTTREILASKNYVKYVKYVKYAAQHVPAPPHRSRPGVWRSHALARSVLARAFPNDTPVRFVIYPWIATVMQGYTDSFEGASTGNAHSPAICAGFSSLIQPVSTEFM